MSNTVLKHLSRLKIVLKHCSDEQDFKDLPPQVVLCKTMDHEA